MWKYALLISYVGGPFCGWQKQKHSTITSVQSELEKCLTKITGEVTSMVGSGRTDAGVHAIGQVAHFVLRQKHWDTQILFRAFNGTLSSKIKVIAVQEVDITFHAQRSAMKKQYSYYFQQGPAPIPYLEPHHWWIRKTLDVPAMTRGLSCLVGQHDFKPFQASGAAPGQTVRTILEAEVREQPCVEFFPVHEIHLIRVRIVGTGFLKQMVRGIVGTLLQVGEGRRPPECFEEILQSKDRNQVGPTAPARGLWLERVWYPAEFKLAWQPDLDILGQSSLKHPDEI